ncbi:TonB-dependent siderophore receptor [Bombella intestini]|uniref:TonB-dependent siderophore receptor n=1 Tax=Bombella intestini TaxID=1539051 RepID=UPI001F4DB0E7|nr:TonB-dependent siderophore receptor [Bombella intestini]
MKTATPLETTPQNLTVVSRARMDMLNSRTLTEAIRYSAGVSDYGGKDDPRGYFGTIRGFTPDIYLDGTRTPNAATSQSFSIEPWGMEEMDIIRGSSSALYGSGQLGGIINAVSKRPTKNQVNVVSVQGGSYARRQGAVDIGGTIDEQGHWMWRFNGLIRKSGTFAHHIKNNEIYVAPSLRWQPSSRTDFTFLSSYEQLDAGSSSQFLPYVGTVVPSRYGYLPRNFLSGNWNFDVYSKRQISVGYALKQEILPGWTISQNMRFAHINVLYRTVAQPKLINTDTISRTALLQSGNYNTTTLDTRSEWKDHFGSVHSTLLTGVDFRSDFMAERRGEGKAPNLALYRPIYSTIAMPSYASKRNYNTTGTQTGIYGQEQADWKRFFLTLSGRGDFTQSLQVNNSNGGRTSQKNNAFTGRVALLYQSTWGVAPYISYATSFSPQLGTTHDGTAFSPTRGRLLEAGIKYKPRRDSIFGDRFLLTLDVFTLKERNELVQDPVYSSDKIQLGAQRTRGFEAEFVGRLPYKIDLLAAFTVQDPRVTKGSAATQNQVGQRPTTVPSRMASFFLRRSFALTHSLSAGIGGGLRYTSTTAGALPNTIIVPSQLVGDIEAHLDYRRWHLQLNGTNIANSKYVSVCTSTTNCSYAPGRALYGDLSYRW